MQQRTINKDWGVLFGDIFIAPFLGPALGYRKIPKISPSKYKPPKPVTQKTLR